MYIGEVLLLGFTLASLGFRAWRQTFDALGDPDDETEDPDEHMARVPPLTLPVCRAAFSSERGLCTPPRSTHLSGKCQRTPAAHVMSDRADDENAALTPASTDSGSAVTVDIAVDAGAALASLSSTAAADPLLTFLSRLPLEEKLSIIVNWLSLVSNCLTYFLRPSQVLYTFLLTNGHLVLFATWYSRRYMHLHHDQLPARRPPTLYTSIPSECRRELCFTCFETASRATGATAEAQPRDTMVCLGGGSSAEPAMVRVPPRSACSPFKATSTAVLERRQHHGEDYHLRGSCATERELEGVPLAGEGAMVTPPLPLPPTATLRRSRRRLWWYMCRGVAMAQTQLSCLLLFNALLTAALVLFHQHHLFFELGTLVGYMAAVASVFQCGMEMGCIVVRLRRRWPRCRMAQTPGDGAAAATAADAMSSVDELLLGADPYSGIQGPAVAFLGEHLSSCACAALYMWMLLDEGDVLWVSHTALVRWYVCSLAIMVFSILKCLRVCF
ncbi:hypothetical protein LSCM1_00804 [Leishmania martiniquensis]|uniref:Uncharacterized protein n=1 Tax=Leishmania martiniquensis TaxID=1580590 RepID=A0A836GFN1_9TRYP|nr:hypothetical protein LSCM1_00804 [Leishmania martiniquensis]